MLRTALLIVLAALSALPAMAQGVDGHLVYGTYEKTHSDSEDRSVSTLLQFYGGNVPSYSYGEEVTGTTAPSVTTRSFAADAPDRDPERTRTLFNALVEARVCDIPPDTDFASDGYFAHLSVDYGDISCRLYFNTPPTDPRRAAIHKLLMDYAADMGIDRPARKAAQVRTSQGDREPAVSVTIPQLLARPGAYDGRRVAVTGYVWLEFEGRSLCAKEYPGKGEDLQCLWYGEPSSFAAPGAAEERDRSWARVEGVFFKGPAGHLGMSPGAITRMTKTEAASAPSLR